MNKQDTRDKLALILDALRDLKDNNTIINRVERDLLDIAYNRINEARYNLGIRN